MASVDDRIVRMEFDNAAFERKIDATIASLAKLEKSLKFDGAKQGFADISAAAGRFNLGNIGTVIEGVSSKFLALGTIAITTLASITSKALSTATNLVKAFSFDPVMAGAREYETNLNSIQTILANTASKGTTMDQVTAALDKLNEYSDKTIYNFGQMAKNIGTFTAAGVDLDTSVSSIKGIANLAAMSGSSAEQASNAMYQLSQAIATGSLKLMDWNSVVNAGMGGEAFKSALFETGKAMKTLTGVPMKQTFKQWEDAGNSFRGSLEKEWITAEVLTTTLEGFTGDLTEEMLIAKGFSQLQATNIAKTAAIARAAATEVKTFSQLMGTVKEAVGTGWADSFKIVIGNFTEAKALWTDVNNSIGAFVSKSADARNALLQGWKDLGGRALLISALKEAFRNLGEVLAPIKEAFRDIFPKTTAKQLMALTQGFYAFAAALKPSEKTVKNIGRIFRGFFGIIEIGWTILKEGVKLIRDVIGEFTGLGEGGILEFLGNIGKFFTDLNRNLVLGEGIKRFFADLTDTIKDGVAFVIEFKDNMIEFFKNFDIGNIGDVVPAFDGMGDAFGRVSDRFQTLKDAFAKAKEFFAPIKDALDEVVKWLDKAWDAIHDWFAELGQKIADVMGEGDFDAALDAINVALLGGIAALLAKFIKDGFSFDIGSGFLEKIGKSFEQLTGVLKTMQADIKANALLKIAAAIALLTASVLVLSLIDSAALTKALTAMAIGFGQLMGTFAIINKIGADPKGAAQFAVIAGGMILLAGSVAVLAGAVAILGNLSWDELGRGLAGVTVLLGIMVGAVVLLSKHAKSMFVIGLGMIAIATAISILAGAVAIFATMSWGELAKGFGGVAAGLLIIAGAMHLMPKSMILTGPALLQIAIALNLLAGAVLIFATMSWEDIGKGMVGIAGGLLIIAGAMHLMPLSLPLLASGILVVALALTVIAGAMKIFGSMSWEEIGRGLVVMAASLLILAIACFAMKTALHGAIAIAVVAGSLMLLAIVLKLMASISWGDLIKGLVGIAAIFAVLGLAALAMQPILPALFLLGAALTLIGIGFALFGLGAQMVAKAFELLAKSGAAGAEALGEILKSLGKALPMLLAGLAEGIVELALILTKAAPVFAKLLVEILQHLLEGLSKLIPEVAKVIGTLISSLLKLIREKYPELVETGIGILVALLTGIRNNIGMITELIIQIIVEFVQALTDNIGDIVNAGLELLLAFIDGIIDNVFMIVDAVVELIVRFMDELVKNYNKITSAAIDMLIEFGKGISDNVSKLATAATDIVIGLMTDIAANFWRLVTTAVDLVVDFADKIGDEAWRLATAAADLITELIKALGTEAERVVGEGVDVVLKFLEGLGKNALKLADGALTVMVQFLHGLETAINKNAKDLREAGIRIVGAIINGMTFGLAEKAKSVGEAVVGVASGAVKEAKNFLRVVGDPYSLVFMGIGESMMNGMRMALDADTSVENSSAGVVSRATDVFNNSLAQLSKDLGETTEFNPTITPVMDLTRIAQDAKKLSTYIQSPTYSYAQARGIASTTNEQLMEANTTPTDAAGVRFEQNIYSPSQLSTSDIYKNTRNQITLAKEELSIP